MPAVLFDYDGTLLDSVEEVYRGLCHVFARSGVTPPSFIQFCATYTSPYLPFYRRHGITAPDEDLNRWYFEVAKNDQSSFFPDAVPVVEALGVRQVLMGIVSAHFEDQVQARCHVAGLSRYMRMIAGRVHEKTDAIIRFCDKHDVPRTETYYVGDFISDVHDAKRAGVIAVGITREKGTDDALRQAGADHVITHLGELLHLPGLQQLV